VRFERDESKNEENIAKHGFDFVDAAEVFQSPMLTWPDSRFDYGENRWIGIGLSNTKVVVVVFVEREKVTRIISMRKALYHERQQYEAYIQNRLGAN
jgi:uncharacterized DUF497 family protein